VLVSGWIGDAVLDGCQVENKSISSRSGAVAGEPMGGHGLVLGILQVENIWCPEGGMGWCCVVDQPLHQGEVDHWCWRRDWGRWHRWPGGGRVPELVGLLGSVSVVCWVVIIGSGSIGVMGRRGRFGLSAVVLVLGVVGAWLGVSFNVL